MLYFIILKLLKILKTPPLSTTHILKKYVLYIFICPLGPSTEKPNKKLIPPSKIGFWCELCRATFGTTTLPQIRYLWYIVQSTTFCGTCIFFQWERLILIMWLGLTNHRGRILTFSDCLGKNCKYKIYHSSFKI